ncbi:MAG: hypothetical protein GEV07_21235 [Streptosporangiales bacterium]|nr:hypothetical protein [Streptosporangiales bacterium]
MLPAFVPPMLAVTGELPADDAGWAFEPKWDGVRVVACLGGGELSLWSRVGNLVTASYPELSVLTGLVGVPAVLDGEVVAFDPEGRPDFGLLQQRMHLTKAVDVRRARRDVQVTYVVFDLLQLDGHDTTGLPLRDRRELLEQLELRADGKVQVPGYVTGNGREVYDATKRLGLEGVVAKRLESVYRPGKRSDAWVKVKHVDSRDVLVAGWLPGEGRRAGTVGAVVLALPDGHGGLRHVGQVGTGFSDQVLDQLYAMFTAEEVADSPLRGQLDPAAERSVHWVPPTRVAEVVHTGWTRDNRLRAAVWRGLRPDLDATQVDPDGR